MHHSNDNKPPSWELIAELHFFCEDYSSLIRGISALPAEHKHRFAGIIKSLTERLDKIHDAAAKL